MLDPLSHDLLRLRAACEAGDREAAAGWLTSMRARDPEHPLTWLGQSRLAEAEGRPEAACEACERALAHDPNLFEAWLSLGRLRAGLRQYSAAIAVLGQALRLRPLSPDALRLLIGLLQLSGDVPAVEACLALLLDPELARQPAWQALIPAEREALAAQLPAWDALGIVDAFSWRESPTSELLARLRAWGARHLASLPTVPAGHGHLLRSPGRPLRIAYVSGEWESPYLRHVYFAAWRQADRERFVTIAYRDDSARPVLPEAIAPAFDLVRASAGWDALRFYQQVQADRVDVLVDLSGLFNPRRLAGLALRPAPVQINAGSNPPFTLGLACFDALFSDKVLTPPERAASYVEPVAYLETFLRWQAPAAPPPPAPGGSGLRLGAGVSPNKLSDASLRLWARTLAALPEARLCLKNQTFLDAGLRERLSRRFAALGGDAARLDFEDNRERAAMLPFFAECDLILDATPYAGALTVCDAFYAGVPVLGLRGERRIAESVRHCLASPELLADDSDDFVARALALCAAPERLVAYRHELPRRLLASPAVDAAGQMREMEAHYLRLWEAWRGLGEDLP